MRTRASCTTPRRRRPVSQGTSRTVLHRHGRARSAGGDRKALEQPGREAGGPDGDHLAVAVDLGSRTRGERRSPSRSCRPGTPRRSRRPRPGAGQVVEVDRRMVSGGKPWGSAPTTRRPWPVRSKSRTAAIDTTHGHQHGRGRSAPSAAGPGSAPGSPRRPRVLRRPPRRGRRRGRTLGPRGRAVGVDGEAAQLGQLADQDRQRQAVHVTRLGRLATGGRPRSRGAADRRPGSCAPDHQGQDGGVARPPRRGRCRAASSGEMVAAITGPSDESGPSTRTRDGPNTA